MTQVTKVAVLGPRGRMGTAIRDAIDGVDDVDVVATVGSNDSVESISTSGASVAVDVSVLAASLQSLPRMAQMGIHAVVGTTGFATDDVSALDHAFREAGKTCLLVPNFSIGAVLMMRFAEQAAPYFDGVEIIELHHDKKKDAPSGTAVLTATRIDAARQGVSWRPDPTEHETVPGSRGGEVRPGVRVHSVRLPGLLAHQEVLFGTAGQTLTIRHDSYDRVAFMPGVLRAIRGVSTLEPGVVQGLDAVL